MTLEDLRRRVIFHNSIDVWIEACGEAGSAWDDPARYRAFIAHLRSGGVGLKDFGLCAHDAGAEDEARAAFAEALAQGKDDPDSRAYTIKLTDSALAAARAYF